MMGCGDCESRKNDPEQVGCWKDQSTYIIMPKDSMYTYTYVCHVWDASVPPHSAPLFALFCGHRARTHMADEESNPSEG